MIWRMSPEGNEAFAVARSDYGVAVAYMEFWDVILETWRGGEQVRRGVLTNTQRNDVRYLSLATDGASRVVVTWFNVAEAWVAYRVVSLNTGIIYPGGERAVAWCDTPPCPVAVAPFTDGYELGWVSNSTLVRQHFPWNTTFTEGVKRVAENVSNWIRFAGRAGVWESSGGGVYFAEGSESPTFLGRGKEPCLVVREYGGYGVSWRSPQSALYYQSPPGRGEVVTLANTTAFNGGILEVQGMVVAAWVGGDNSSLFFRIFSDAGLGAPRKVVGNATRPQLTSTPAGFALAWADSTSNNIFFNEYTVSIVTSHTATVVADRPTSSSPLLSHTATALVSVAAVMAVVASTIAVRSGWPARESGQQQPPVGVDAPDDEAYIPMTAQ